MTCTTSIDFTNYFNQLKHLPSSRPRRKTVSQSLPPLANGSGPFLLTRVPRLRSPTPTGHPSIRPHRFLRPRAVLRRRPRSLPEDEIQLPDHRPRLRPKQMPCPRLRSLQRQNLRFQEAASLLQQLHQRLCQSMERQNHSHRQLWSNPHPPRFS